MPSLTVVSPEKVLADVPPKVRVPRPSLVSGVLTNPLPSTMEEVMARSSPEATPRFTVQVRVADAVVPNKASASVPPVISEPAVAPVPRLPAE